MHIWRFTWQTNFPPKNHVRRQFEIFSRPVAVYCWTILDVTQLWCTVAMFCYVRMLQELNDQVGLVRITMKGSSRWQHVNNTVRQMDRERNQCYWDNTAINLALGGQEPLYKQDLYQVNSVAHHRLNNTVPNCYHHRLCDRSDPREASVSFVIVLLLFVL